MPWWRKKQRKNFRYGWNEKMCLLVKGKAANARCFKNINVANLGKQILLFYFKIHENLTWRWILITIFHGIDYYSNSKAWMTSEIFAGLAEKTWKAHEKNEKRKVLLLLDNFSGHFTSANEELTNVKLCFLPPNTTSKLQPLDQGIIASLKKSKNQNWWVTY